MNANEIIKEYKKIEEDLNLLHNQLILATNRSDFFCLSQDIFSEKLAKRMTNLDVSKDMDRIYDEIHKKSICKNSLEQEYANLQKSHPNLHRVNLRDYLQNLCDCKNTNFKPEKVKVRYSLCDEAEDFTDLENLFDKRKFDLDYMCILIDLSSSLAIKCPLTQVTFSDNTTLRENVVLKKGRRIIEPSLTDLANGIKEEKEIDSLEISVKNWQNMNIQLPLKIMAANSLEPCYLAAELTMKQERAQDELEQE